MDDFPRIGLVIRHLYLWRREQIKGQEEGLKARPCLVVHTKQNDFDETEVFICPITHTPPHDSTQALEIPLPTKQRLHLDDDRSWIITNEVNRFTWKGTDVVNTEHGDKAYGYLPSGLIKAAINKVIEHNRQRGLNVINRDDPELLRQIRERQLLAQARDDDRDR
jgi:mRNA-degrading endonuclease toxin of MazEF toxin-antitoxin module